METWTKTCGPIPSVLVLTHAHLAQSLGPRSSPSRGAEPTQAPLGLGSHAHFDGEGSEIRKSEPWHLEPCSYPLPNPLQTQGILHPSPAQTTLDTWSVTAKATQRRFPQVRQCLAFPRSPRTPSPYLLAQSDFLNLSWLPVQN